MSASSDDDVDPKLLEKQSPELIRQIRKDYRDLIRQLDDSKEQYLDLNNTDLAELIEKANRLYKQVIRTQEATLDSQAMRKLAEIIAAKSEKLRNNTNRFDVSGFAKRVREKYGQGDEDNMEFEWNRMGEMVLRHCKKPPTVGFMFGPLAIKVKQKREPVNRQKREKVDQVHVKELTQEELEKQSAVETTRLVQKVFSALAAAQGATKGSDTANNKPIDLIEFVTNPDKERGFSQTIENLFYVSFLIRDDKVGWHFGDDGLLYITRKQEIEEGYQADAQQTTSKQGKRQLIVNLSYQNWKDAVELYEIKTPLIPNRDAVPEAARTWKG